MTDDSGMPAPARDIELPMCFYLGREYDLAKKKIQSQPVLYDAKDLTTHGVVVGMTGSGKTGVAEQRRARKRYLPGGKGSRSRARSKRFRSPNHRFLRARLSH